MDWGKLLGGLGNAGDILSGKESYNSIKRGNMADTTANRQISSSDTQAAERNNLQKLMQKIQIAADTLSQGSQQGHQREMQFNQLGSSGVQNQLDREQRERMQGTDIGARKDLSILNNDAQMAQTLAPIRQQQQQRNDAGFYSPVPQWMSEKLGIPMGLTPAQLSVLGPAGVSAASATDPMMTKAFGNTFTQMQAQQNQAEFLRSLGLGQQLQPGVGTVGPGGVPMTGTNAPIRPRSGNY